MKLKHHSRRLKQQMSLRMRTCGSGGKLFTAVRQRHARLRARHARTEFLHRATLSAAVKDFLQPGANEELARAQQTRLFGRSPQLQVRASEVVRLWVAPNTLAELKAQYPTQSKSVRIAAVRPDQALSIEDYEVLEDCGVLVVQVPTSIPSDSDEDVAEYLTAQLRAGTVATAWRMAAVRTVDTVFGAAHQSNTDFSGKAEEEFVELLNDPESQLGARS